MLSPDIQFSRLRRHYDECIEELDEVSLYNLAHSLRTITEYKHALNSQYKDKSLAHVRMPKILKKQLSKTIFVSAPFDGLLQLKNMKMGSFFFAKKALSPEAAKRISNPNTIWPSKKLNFTDWMGADAVIYRVSESEGINAFTRERLIKRVSNYLGPSHAIKLENGNRKKEDNLLLSLLDFQCAERPFPYFVLMKIAQDILVFTDKLEIANQAG